MAKIYPNSPSTSNTVVEDKEEVMTVWRKSLLFNCKGFTVFDSRGNLMFRVDNYSSRSKREIVLMDGSGSPLFTIKRKKLIIGENWTIYDGEDTTNPKFSVAKNAKLRQSKTLAYVHMQKLQCYVIEGSYSHRSCTVFDDRRRAVAKIERKETSKGVALGDDVFKLVVNSRLDSSLAMAIVVLLDQML